jgi:hypothetical protein
MHEQAEEKKDTRWNMELLLLKTKSGDENRESVLVLRVGTTTYKLMNNEQEGATRCKSDVLG